MSDKRATEIEQLIEAERWVDARKACLAWLERSPEDHWLMARVALTHYEQGDYEAALAWADKAQALAPDCPLVLWERAGALDMLEREAEALATYRGLLERGSERVGGEVCGEGVAWAHGLLADCAYRAGCCLLDLGDKEKGRAMLRHALEMAVLGAEGIYTPDDIVEQLARVHPGRRRAALDAAIGATAGALA